MFKLSKFNNISIYLLIALFGGILFLPFLGNVHLFDWDEINFAEAAREMIVTNDFFFVKIDFQPFHEKPPLFFWLQVIAFKLFGVNEFAARLPNALIGIASLLFIYHVGRIFFSRNMGILWVLAYSGSFLPHFYFRTGIIDPLFNLFIFASVYFLFNFFILYINEASSYSRKAYFNLFYAGLMVSLAFMTKGPVGWLLPALLFGAFSLIGKFNLLRRKAFIPPRSDIKLPWKAFFIFSAVSLLIPILYYAYIYLFVSHELVVKFINYQFRLLTTGDAGHSGPIYYHLVVLFLGCFPASVFLLRALSKFDADNLHQKIFKELNIILLVIIIVIFSIVKTKIVHYSSLAYFPITFLAAYSLNNILFRGGRWKLSTNWLIGGFSLLWSILFVGLPLLLMNIDLLIPRIKDQFTREVLLSNVHWSEFELLPGIIYLILSAIVIFLLINKSYLKAVVASFASTALIISLFLPIVTPKIEIYTQGAPIEFYKSKQSEDCYVYAIGFKSYAQHFYTLKQPVNSRSHRGLTDAQFRDWLLFGKIDKPAYFVTKNKKVNDYLIIDGVNLLYVKNGFAFLKRNSTDQ